MNFKKQERLSELKHKYFLKYTLIPKLKIFSCSTPFRLEEIMVFGKRLIKNEI